MDNQIDLITVGSVWHMIGVASVKVIVASTSGDRVRFVRLIVTAENQIHNELPLETFRRDYVFVAPVANPDMFKPARVDLEPIVVSRNWTAKSRDHRAVRVNSVSELLVEFSVVDSTSAHSETLDPWVFRHRFQRQA